MHCLLYSSQFFCLIYSEKRVMDYVTLITGMIELEKHDLLVCSRTVKITSAARQCLKQMISRTIPVNCVTLWRESRYFAVDRRSARLICRLNSPSKQTGLNRDFNLSTKLAIAEEDILRTALQQSNGNRTEAARLPGISRKNLWGKNENLQLAVGEGVSGTQKAEFAASLQKESPLQRPNCLRNQGCRSWELKSGYRIPFSPTV